MPKINSQKKESVDVKKINNDFRNMKDEVYKIKMLLATLRAEMDKQLILQKQDEELRTKFGTFISYNLKDKKRLNTVIKDVNHIKKQINLSKVSPIMTKLLELEERMDNLENNNEDEL